MVLIHIWFQSALDKCRVQQCLCHMEPFAFSFSGTRGLPWGGTLSEVGGFTLNRTMPTVAPVVELDKYEDRGPESRG